MLSIFMDMVMILRVTYGWFLGCRRRIWSMPWKFEQCTPKLSWKKSDSKFREKTLQGEQVNCNWALNLKARHPSWSRQIWNDYQMAPSISVKGVWSSLGDVGFIGDSSKTFQRWTIDYSSLLKKNQSFSLMDVL